MAGDSLVGVRHLPNDANVLTAHTDDRLRAGAGIRRLEQTVILRRFLAFAFLLVLMVHTDAVRAQQYPVIVNEEKRPDPWIINGCEIRPNTSCERADLRHADLYRADLSGANLKGARLARANLRYAKLTNANLEGADLEAADMRITFLARANFTNANLQGANLSSARASKATFAGANLRAASMEAAWAKETNFRGASFVNANLQETKLYGANLSSATFEGTFIRFAIFQDAFMDGCKGCPMTWQTNTPAWAEDLDRWIPAGPQPNDQE